MKYQTLSSEIINENPYWKYKKENYIMPNEAVGEYHFVASKGSTMIIPRTDDGCFLMCAQYRYLNKKMSLEFPGGGQETGISSVENAEKELREELGYTAGVIDYVGEFNPFNGVTDEICKVYVASDLTFEGQELEDSEEIEIFKFSRDEIKKKIRTNEIWDGMTAAAWALYYFEKY